MKESSYTASVSASGLIQHPHPVHRKHLLRMFQIEGDLGSRRRESPTASLSNSMMFPTQAANLD